MVRWEWDWYTEDWRARHRASIRKRWGRPVWRGGVDAESTPKGPSYPLLQEDAPDRSPMRSGAFLCPPWGTLALRLLAVGGLCIQIVLAWACYELVDLALSLMEVWAELARKHLEITL